MTLIHFTTLAGATMYFPPNGLRPRRVALEERFHAALEAMFADLWPRCPWGQAQWIGSLGCMVPSTPKRDTGRHNSGEAFDLSDLIWPGADVPTPSVRIVHIGAGDPTPLGAVPEEALRPFRARYLAVEAIVRKHFQTALDWWHPTAHAGKPPTWDHRDHWHIDSGRGEPTWEGRKNQVMFLQAALRYVWGAGELKIDGDFGPKTKLAVDEATGRRWEAGWIEFLEETARRGFAL